MARPNGTKKPRPSLSVATIFRQLFFTDRFELACNLIKECRMIVPEIMGSPVSGFFHLSHRPAKLSTPPSAALMKYGCLPS
jgi:hypothetical protein